MGKKITIVLSDKVEEEVRDHIRMKYRKPFGKLSSFIEEAVVAELKRVQEEE